MTRALALLLLAAPLAACGLRPLYGAGATSATAQSLREVMVAPIDERSGWLLRNALVDRLAGAGEAADARYRLDVVIDDDITKFGLRGDAGATRERRALRARYQLVDLATGETLVDATAGFDAGIDITSSPYATVAAEQSALERLSMEVADDIVARLALYFDRIGTP
ncbi:LPS assembly lipoprotein LptE [Sphingomicrobium astaxanthinifaciens]|uniref:LPS assembly lipoprotein LptE n=1 Tax=Sphingomicrobium astaxanthinifaciens TaxID=1227949 RepID=UPI001FCB31CB|nr:LPS assembly lipoprotein LptE [Sphingomicrobium astaxanthinifaciens]MCJ7421183.1 LPS assembly lipoprotein LptE [Sphingomicrobium astaxanthinifaciens]